MARIDAEHWLAEVHRDIAGDIWRHPQKETGTGSEMAFLTGFARHCLTERDLTPRTREEYTKLLEGLILPSLGAVKLRYLEPEQVRRWYSTVLNDDRATQRKHAYALLRSILRDAEEEGPIERTPAGSGTPAGGVVHVGPPKTAAGIREAGIPPHLLNHLAAYEASLPVAGRDGYLFPGHDAGRDDLTFHDMRHSAASLAGMTAATTAELKAMMGHATAGMVERYQHANKRARARLVQNMTKLVDP